MLLNTEQLCDCQPTMQHNNAAVIPLHSSHRLPSTCH